MSSGTSVELSQKNQLVAQLLERKYGAWLGQRFVEVESHSDGAVLTIKITLRNRDKSYVYPIEGRIMFADQDMTADETRDFLMDFMDAYIQEYLSGGEETYLTIDWSNYDCDGVELQLRGQILNVNLEDLAEQLINGSEAVH
ncbi:MAG: hypothetical protein WCO71_00825 [Pseudomonadota bacterium]